MGSIPGLGRSPGEGKGYPLQNPMDCIVHGVSKSRTRLSDFHFHFESPGTQSLSGSLAGPDRKLHYLVLRSHTESPLLRGAASRRGSLVRPSGMASSIY